MNEFDDPFSLFPQSRPSGRVDREGREIQLIGPPILAWNPKTNNQSVPDDYKTHSAVRGKYFLTLPSDVLKAVVAELGEERFDAEMLAMERQLSRICGNHVTTVGFWHDAVIPYRELRFLELPSFSDENIRKCGMNPAKLGRVLQVYQDRDIPALERFCKGYCGWLMINKQFLDERDALLAAHEEAVRRWGTQPTAQSMSQSPKHLERGGSQPGDDACWSIFVTDREQFLARWRLAALAGPNLPVPLKPLMAGTFPSAIVQQMMAAGGMFFLPDTMPIPSRDQLRGMLDHALHQREGTNHLEEWLHIVRADNMARNRMDPFARYFELQHYWRILHERHAAAINRKVGVLEVVFGEIFRVSQQQIHRDLVEIRKRLGSDWLKRRSIFD